jgi:uncharacterized membrane protein YphA (DoxX/SURF4 family)
MAYLTFALRLGIGALLIVAGVLKAHDGPVATATSIAGYRMLPASIVAPLGVALPYAEILLGAYLVLGLFTRVAAWLAAAQFAIFSLAVGSLVVRGIPADCGCFGSSIPTPPTWGHVVLDAALAALAVVVAWKAPGAFSLDGRFFFSVAASGGGLDPQAEA